MRKVTNILKHKYNCESKVDKIMENMKMEICAHMSITGIEEKTAKK